jgi:hypothetical protein
MSYTEIQNPDRYDAAVRARIKANARKGRGARWLAERPDRAALIGWLQNTARGDYAQKMRDAYDDWGSLTDGQEAAVRRMRDEAAARQVEDAKSAFVGTVGQRETFAGLTVLGVYEQDGDYGTTYSVKLRDVAGNLFHWRASNCPGIESGPSFTKYLPGADGHTSVWTALDRGQVVTLKATIKDHYTSRAGIKSTILTRAKVEAIASAAAPAAVAAPAPVEASKPRGSLLEIAAQIEARRKGRLEDAASDLAGEVHAFEHPEAAR